MSLRTPSKLTLAAPATWPNMPAALSYYLGSSGYQTAVDLTDADQARLNVNVVTAGATGAAIVLQYSTDNGTTWSTAFSVPVDSVGLKKTAWATVPDAAKGDVLIRLGGQGGNGAADPVFGLIVLEFVGSTTFEVTGLLWHFMRNLNGLVFDMRSNARGVIAAASLPGANAATLAAGLKSASVQYTRRLGWLTTAFGSYPTACTQALAAMGLTVAQATSLRDSLQAVADHTATATMATLDDVTAESNYQLENVPDYGWIIPG